MKRRCKRHRNELFVARVDIALPVSHRTAPPKVIQKALPARLATSSVCLCILRVDSNGPYLHRRNEKYPLLLVLAVVRLHCLSVLSLVLLWWLELLVILSATLTASSSPRKWSWNRGSEWKRVGRGERFWVRSRTCCYLGIQENEGNCCSHQESRAAETGLGALGEKHPVFCRRLVEASGRASWS